MAKIAEETRSDLKNYREAERARIGDAVLRDLGVSAGDRKNISLRLFFKETPSRNPSPFNYGPDVVRGRINGEKLGEKGVEFFLNTRTGVFLAGVMREPLEIEKTSGLIKTNKFVGKTLVQALAEIAESDSGIHTMSFPVTGFEMQASGGICLESNRGQLRTVNLACEDSFREEKFENRSPEQSEALLKKLFPGRSVKCEGVAGSNRSCVLNEPMSLTFPIVTAEPEDLDLGGAHFYRRAVDGEALFRLANNSDALKTKE